MKEGEKYLNMAHHHQDQRQQQYESGLEVADTQGPWHRNDIPLPEMTPYIHVDAKTATTPQVADDPASWHHYYKQNPGLEVVSSPSVTTPGGYGGTTAAAYSQDSGSAYGANGQQHPPGYHHPSPDAKYADAEGRGKMCGVRRKLCYIIMGVAIVLVVAAIAIGVGVGLATRRQSDSDNSSSDNSTTPESTKTANIVCPASDNATYSAQDAPARHFRLICGHDYNADAGAIDLTSANATTMAACIDLCAAKSDCVGAGWGVYYGDHICWMKSRLGEMNTSGNWIFAVDVNKTSTTST
ncbi:uncharacterized protein ColSpa_12593 [Colletotrichum spaethianum]|uniref:Apple domain-containing protein n=1 Tax=Colletotrichum spaethianum TaxID=700344 RepID=A0AA37USE7_9PEZI|nr:uncharacterized protein ColSpa_12593 [Colletotrichum spaethianum]GKT52412.1 hypothetical protein ColSpa_12593 [Colletotrichum spaethianum]